MDYKELLEKSKSKLRLTRGKLVIHKMIYKFGELCGEHKYMQASQFLDFVSKVLDDVVLECNLVDEDYFDKNLKEWLKKTEEKNG